MAVATFVALVAVVAVPAEPDTFPVKFPTNVPVVSVPVEAGLYVNPLVHPGSAGVVPLDIKSCPVVPAEVTSTPPVPSPITTPFAASVFWPVPPCATATIPVTLAAVPVTLPAIGAVTVSAASVPTDVSEEFTTVELSVVPVSPLAGTLVAAIVPPPVVAIEPLVSNAAVFVALVIELKGIVPLYVPDSVPEKVVAVSVPVPGLYVSEEFTSAPWLPLIAPTNTG